MEEIELSRLPTVDLGPLVVYDAFVMRNLPTYMLPQKMVGGIAHDTFSQMLSRDGVTWNHEVADQIGRALWPFFVKEPPAPEIDDEGYVPAVWRYIIVPSALVSVAVCLDYWTGQKMRNLSYLKLDGRVFAGGSLHAIAHAEEYLRSKQTLFEVLGATEAGKYAGALATRDPRPGKWVKKLCKIDKRTEPLVSGLGHSYRKLLRPPLTVADNDDRLIVWLIDKHFRHPDGPFLAPRLEPGVLEYGGACATTYALILSFIYDDTTNRLSKILPPTGRFRLTPMGPAT